MRKGGLPAALLRGLDAEVGADIAQVEGLGMERPQGDGFSGGLGEDNEAVDDGEHFIEQEFAVNGFGPRLDFGELEEVRLGFHGAAFSFSA
jgi:hypothetical protein